MIVSEVARIFFSAVWRGLIQVDYPGVGVSVAGVMVSFLLMRLSISIFKYLTGFSASGSDYGRATDSVYRGKAKHDFHNKLFGQHD